MSEAISIKRFSEVSLDDNFFDSLKADYPKFAEWYNGKAAKGTEAFVQFADDGGLQAFLYMKIEEASDVDNTIEPLLPAQKKLKVGTFKIDGHGTKFGERFVKKIFDKAIEDDVEYVYVTIFNKAPQDRLIDLLSKYGFKNYGKKGGTEDVYVKDMRTVSGNQLMDYPLISKGGKRKFLLSIYPLYHTKLFPDSILKNEYLRKDDLIRDVSPTNSIHKIYICFMRDTEYLLPGDLLVIYRTNDGQGSAYYRSVATSVCEVEEVKLKKDFANVNDFITYTNKYSVFNEPDLRQWYSRGCVVIKMTYNVAFKRRVTRKTMLEDIGISPDLYWGFFSLSDGEFDDICRYGGVDENIFVKPAQGRK